MAPLFWACDLLGAILTAVRWRASPDEIGYCLEDAEAVVVAYDGAANGAPPKGAARLGIDPRRWIVASDGRGDGVPFETLLAGPPVDGPMGAEEGDTCLMLYTSGTTRRPKGVPRSHRSELAAGSLQIAHHHDRPRGSSLAL